VKKYIKIKTGILGIVLLLIGTGLYAADLTVTGAVKTPTICDENGNNCKAVSSITSQLFGNRIEKTLGTYLAETDGFLHGYVISMGTIANNLLIYTDSNPDPTSLIIRAGKETTSIPIWNYVPFMVPIKKGDYYKIVSENSVVASIYWMPIGN